MFVSQIIQLSVYFDGKWTSSTKYEEKYDDHGIRSLRDGSLGHAVYT